MLNYFAKKPFNPINKNFNDYCKKCMDDSIRKINENYNLERNKPKIVNPFDNKNNDNPDFNIYGFLTFLSISTITFLFYKRLT
jgi:hypothetical protein